MQTFVIDLLMLALAVQGMYLVAGLLTDPRNEEWQRGCADWTFQTMGGLKRVRGRHERYHIMCNYCQVATYSALGQLK